MLARFDCDLSLDVHDIEMKERDIFSDPEINFKFGLSERQRKRIDAAAVDADLKLTEYSDQATWRELLKCHLCDRTAANWRIGFDAWALYFGGQKRQQYPSM